jgi:recombination protein RecA
MPSASAIRLQIETALAHRIPSALTPRTRIIRPVAPTGIAEVDEVLGGGLPLGAITEMTGPECSGRSSVALSFISRLTRAGNVCAWIDVSDALSPESAAAADVDLARLLWVRCGVLTRKVQPTTGYRFTLPEKYLVAPPGKQGLHGGGCGGHPRGEVKGLPEAVGNLLRPEVIAPRCAEPLPRRKPEPNAFEPNLQRLPQEKIRGAQACKPWARIKQALSTADLLLQTGGFSAIIIDLAGIAPEFVSRVEASIWFRYRAAAERTQASVLLLTQYPCAKSSGELLLQFRPGIARRDETTLFTGVECGLEVERQRFAQSATNVVPLRRPPQRANVAHWKNQTVWAGAR